MADLTCIYELTDPDSGIGRYLGKADDPCARYREHLQPCRLRADTHKNHWIKSLLEQGKKPGLNILMRCLESLWPIFEQAFIAAYRIRQTRDILTNTQDGGEGSSHGREFSEETRKKISIAKKGKPHSPAHCQALSCAKMGKPRPCCQGEKNHKAKMTEAKVTEARQLYATGEWPQQALVAYFGIAQTTMWRIVTRKAWKYLS